MAKWFDQAREIERLRRENQRLATLVGELTERLAEDAADVDVFGVSADERQMVRDGRQVEAVKAYRERTGADLLTAKKAIDAGTFED
ncbi:MAG: 50S ribosomal protein L7/L12 [Bowdeniella nasicola]|nr:50S ribosomal protein L7/L12 [Bowdeniella nasicola]